MKKYKVGGAVRDQLLGIQGSDIDWVVVGYTPQQMLSKGYKQVGNAFPVFLHPKTKEEYALARKEKKHGIGHKGFRFDHTPNISLEEDLLRRDITINAIAIDENDKIVDPFNGRADLQKGIIRHVSNCFVEDPLRVLRVARFAAQLAKLGFCVATSTIMLMREIVARNELLTLPAERIRAETEKALKSQSPATYFLILQQCNALAQLFPEIERMLGVRQKIEWHPEDDCFVHTMLVINYAAQNFQHNVEIIWTSLMHDFGKGITPQAILPSHTQHEERGVALVEGFCKRLKLAKTISKNALRVTRWHLLYHRAQELSAKGLVKLLVRIDAFRDKTSLDIFTACGEADARGRYQFENYPCQQSDYLRSLAQTMKQLNYSSISKNKSSKMAEIIFQYRVAEAKKFLQQHKA